MIKEYIDMIKEGDELTSKEHIIEKEYDSYMKFYK